MNASKLECCGVNDDDVVELPIMPRYLIIGLLSALDLQQALPHSTKVLNHKQKLPTQTGRGREQDISHLKNGNQKQPLSAT